MNSTTIVGYAYDAAIHCPDCALEAVQGEMLKIDETSRMIDCNGLPYVMLDREGNLVTPIFCGEDAVDQYCDDCNEPIME